MRWPRRLSAHRRRAAAALAHLRAAAVEATRLAKRSARTRLAAKAAAGALVGGAAAHVATLVVTHGDPPWLNWPTVLGAAAGAGIGTAGRRGSHLSALAVMFSIAAVAAYAAFDFHRVAYERTEFAVLGAHVIGASGVEAVADVNLTVEGPGLFGCGDTRMILRIEAPDGPDGSTDRAALVYIEYPWRAELMEFDGEIVRRRDKDALRETRAVSIRTDVGTGTAMNIVLRLRWRNLARPRSVGACYVPLPTITGHEAASLATDGEAPPPGAAPVLAAAGQVVLNEGINGNTLMRDATEPPVSTTGPGGSRWICRPTDASRAACVQGVAVLEASWRRAFEQLMLIVVGAMFALIAEYLIVLARGRTP